MFIINEEARVCSSCFSGDLIPIVAIKGSHRKVKLQRVDCKCTHCGIRVKGKWECEIIESILDKIDDGVALIREYNKWGEYDNVINDISTRVTDSLLSDDDENSPYLRQQLNYINNILHYIKEKEAKLHA